MNGIQYVIYALVLREHPDIVKIGQTTKWSIRRKEYDRWNFANGDGVKESAVYVLTEEYVNLQDIERSCINAMAVQFPLFRGNEWFKADFITAQQIIENVLYTAGITFVR